MTDPVLIEAHNLINGERAVAYGDARAGLQNVADQWGLYIKQKYGAAPALTAEDVCWMMVDLKKMRHLATPKRDNIVDAAGYIGLIERVCDGGIL